LGFSKKEFFNSLLNRALLIEFLLEISQEFDTILVFATSDKAKLSPVPEVLITW
jgi:hypothetical protein